MKFKKVNLPWLDEIPQDWGVVKLKNLGEFYTGNSIADNEKDNYTDNVNSRPYISTKDISKDDGVIDYENGMYIKLNNSSFKIAPLGSTLVCIEGGSGGEKVGYLTKNVSFVNKLCCVKSNDFLCDKFTYFLIKSPQFKIQYNMSISGDRNGVNLQKIGQFFLPLPPKQDQIKIAMFLDDKISKIDKVIKAKQSEIKKLEDLKAYKIQNLLFGQTITKQNYQNVLEILQTTKIKNIFSLRSEKNKLEANQVELLSLYTNYGVLKNKEVEYKTGNKNTTVIDYKIVKINDIVVNIMLCWMGAIGISKYDGVISPAYDVYIPNLNKINPQYYHYLFRTELFKGELFKNGKGIVLMKWRVYSDKFGSIKVPLFSLKQQGDIVKNIKKIEQKINKAKINLQAQIKNLSVLKQSLISRAVSGKIDLKNFKKEI